jgi:hypothetical protein
VIRRTSTLAEVAFAVCTALERSGFRAVLTGGSAATYYAPEAYQSGDLDFVITLRGKEGEKALASLGFERKGDFYRHRRRADQELEHGSARWAGPVRAFTD